MIDHFLDLWPRDDLVFVPEQFVQPLTAVRQEWTEQGLQSINHDQPRIYHRGRAREVSLEERPRLLFAEILVGASRDGQCFLKSGFEPDSFDQAADLAKRLF